TRSMATGYSPRRSAARRLWRRTRSRRMCSATFTWSAKLPRAWMATSPSAARISSSCASTTPARSSRSSRACHAVGPLAHRLHRTRRMATQAFIGISGWRYTPWRGEFYPPGLPERDELKFAAERFATIELNGSFYSLQRPEYYARWYEQVPPDFVFAIKGSRYITHMLRLRGVETALANFFASGVLVLEEKLGPLLWQLPPTLKLDRKLLEEFFALLPRTTKESAKIARRHDKRVKGRAHLHTSGNREL